MILQWIKNLWDFVNKISPETRTLIIILLFGYILYSQIEDVTKTQIKERFQEEINYNKKAELYSMETSIELNSLILMIAEKDTSAFNVLLLSYHNNTQSLQGYKYLYLSCLTEAPRSLDEPLLRQLWNKIDYIYYADELSRIHKTGSVLIQNVDSIKNSFPKLCRLLKASDANAASLYTIEGHESPIGMVVLLYKGNDKPSIHACKAVLMHIQKLAIILDYNNIRK